MYSRTISKTLSPDQAETLEPLEFDNLGRRPNNYVCSTLFL